MRFLEFFWTQIQCILRPYFVRGSRDLALAPLIVFLRLANASCRRLVYHYQLVHTVICLKCCLIAKFYHSVAVTTLFGL